MNGDLDSSPGLDRFARELQVTHVQSNLSLRPHLRKETTWKLTYRTRNFSPATVHSTLNQTWQLRPPENLDHLFPAPQVVIIHRFDCTSGHWQHPLWQARTAMYMLRSYYPGQKNWDSRTHVAQARDARAYVWFASLSHFFWPGYNRMKINRKMATYVARML